MKHRIMQIVDLAVWTVLLLGILWPWRKGVSAEGLDVREGM
jgi:hypothetical protein